VNIDSIATKAVAGVVAIAILTTILARSNTPRVINSIGTAFSGAISSALGKGVAFG
jgi:hypothetical protein